MKQKKPLLRLTIIAIVGILIGFSAFVYVPQYYQAQAYAASDAKAYSVDEELVAANTRFGLAIFKELQKEDQDKNIFISPFSISTALAMTYNGAEGSTKTAMAEALQLDGMSLDKVNEGYFNLMGSLENVDQLVSLKIGNSIWINQSFGPRIDQGFTKRVSDSFRSDVLTRNFSDPETIGEINGWISDKTNGKIDRMIDEIDPSMAMFLINAIYFKGDWTAKFDASKTSKEDFYLSDGSVAKVDMMFVGGTFNYYSGEDFQAIRLPYGRNKTAMYIFLPKEGVPLESFIEGMNQTRLDDYVERLTPESDMEVRIPKFKLEYGGEPAKRLNDVLIRMGMGVAFTLDADFDGMTSTDPANLLIDYVDHKAVIEVNEEGTEAAAATVVGIVLTSQRLSPLSFTANRPFFFVIRDDRSGSILFMGKIMDPLQTVSP